MLLDGQPADPALDGGETVCAWFGVGRNAIDAAAQLMRARMPIGFTPGNAGARSPANLTVRVGGWQSYFGGI